MNKGQKHITFVISRGHRPPPLFCIFHPLLAPVETYFPLFFASSSSLFKTYFGKGADKLSITMHG